MTEKERIEEVMEAEKLNATQFAAEIGIQGSTLSHILNGRNNPSLDVLKRILDRFRTISSDWLILGIGSMYRQIANSQQPVLFDLPPVNTQQDTSMETVRSASSIASTDQSVPLQAKEKTSIQLSDKTITRILIFYSDNTFEEWKK